MRPLPEKLLAKSPPPDPAQPALTLARHCVDTEEAALALFRPGSRWGRNFCRFFGFDDHARFLINLRVAALFHDLGKANEDFQRAVTSPGSPAQCLRHEHISALVLCLPEVRAWLGQSPVLDADAITAAVLSHHLKADEKGDHAWCQPRGKDVLALFLAHADVVEIFARVRAAADLPAPPRLPGDAWSNRPPWSAAWQAGTRNATQFRRELRRNRDRLGLTLALKAGVIAADSVASAMVRTRRSIIEWIEEVAHADAIAPGELHDRLIGPRCRSLAEKRGRPFEFHEFQERAAELGPRALLIAGCGSGKTLAAWLWAERQLAGRELGHVLFLYPTRGTATEGFRDYVAWAPEDEGALVHGTAAYELDAMSQNPSEAMGQKRFALDEAEKRLFALGLWPRRYFSATVDQFLSFLTHRYESMCLLPLLADSAIVLDEVHSYDRAMFSSLVAFLEHFDVPVLCMTATLPPDRKQQLERLGLRVYPEPGDRIELQDLEKAECHPRYRLHRADGDAQAFDRALAAARTGSRVLCVVNTVGRCQELAQRFGHAVGGSPVRVLAYHSRYRLRDRAARHSDAIAAFQARGRHHTRAGHGVIAVTTQVCEMSLDLDADVLISELAPVPSLVQRFGRANRHLAQGEDFRADIYLHEPKSPAPYGREDIDAAHAFLDALGVRPGVPGVELGQRRLAEAFEQHTPRQPSVTDSALFLTGGYYAAADDFRDIDQIGVSCVLDRDISAIEAVWREKGARERRGQPVLDDILPGYEVSVPRKHTLRDAVRPAWLPRYLEIAPADRYDEDLGFLVGENT
ncbi:MAG TPA: CRISPR-associated helicase Cas3' [Haliangium sp.]|nr:CRISPR-associated helicase Cas3' [Haliangium sp.]